MKVSEASQKFSQYLSTNSHAPSTSKTYLSILKKFRKQSLPIEEITPTMVQEFLQRSEKKSPITRNVQKSACRSFFKWCLENDFISRDPSRLIRFEKVPVVEARYFTPEQITKFKSAIKGKGREEVIFTLFLETGLRLSELRSLNCDIKNKSSFLVIGKGGKTREVFLTENLQKMITDHIGKRKDHEPLFKSSWGRRLGVGQISWSFKHYCRLAGIPILSPHALRHTFGTMIYSKTKDLRLTQELLGHSSPAMTMRYSHINQTSKQEALAALWGE